jgi:hypothetical protein
MLFVCLMVFDLHRYVVCLFDGVWSTQVCCLFVWWCLIYTGILFVCLMVFDLHRYVVCLFDGVWCHFQQYFSYIMAISFIGGGNRKTWGKTTDLLPVTDKLYHIMLYTSPWSRFELTTSVVILIGTDCIGSCKIQLPYDHDHNGPYTGMRKVSFIMS